MKQLTKPQNKAFEDYIVLEESEHYWVLFKSNANPFSKDAEYLLVFKDRETIESRDPSYVVILMHMRSAEEAYSALVMLGSIPEPETTGNASLN